MEGAPVPSTGYLIFVFTYLKRFLMFIFHSVLNSLYKVVGFAISQSLGLRV